MRMLHRRSYYPLHRGVLALLFGLAMLIGQANTASAAAGTNTLFAHERLQPGQFLASANGQFRVHMQEDGNLVLYQNGVALWSSQTHGRSGAWLGNQGDGNLVLYHNGVAIWNSGTPGHGPSNLIMQDDGNLVLYKAGNVPTWASRNDSSNDSSIVGNIFADSSNVPCAAGTRDVGIMDGYRSGTLTKIRLCALPNLSSTSEESRPGSAYYIQGANGNALVNSRVSGAVFAMINSAKRAGINISATSTFRTMAHQQALCNGNHLCRNGNYTYVARPGTSNHQMGIAIDFAGTNVKGGTSCTSRATDPGSPVWKWLSDNAARFGYRQYAAESWHWDPLSGPTRC